ncbi:MAG: HAD hydrolase family protein [Candidatus Omnitrophota bacterium]
MTAKKLQARFKKIKLLLLDVDGVLTDGRIIYDSGGRDAKFFDVHDGLGVTLLGRLGVKTILITAKGSGCIDPRAKDMHVEAVYKMDQMSETGMCPKSQAYRAIKKNFEAGDEEICFVGDDLVDLCVMRQCGLPVAVSNAVAEVKKAAVYVTAKPGGRGAVREVAELILKSKGLWEKAVELYT